MLAQVPDIDDFVGGMQDAPRADGVVTMEFPHLLRLIEENQFDTIYHEHFSYFSFLTAAKIFAAHGLVVFDVEELPTHGGSLRIYARHAGRHVEAGRGRMKELLARELSMGLDRIGRYAPSAER